MRLSVGQLDEDDFAAWTELGWRGLLHGRRLAAADIARRKARMAGHRLLAGTLDGELVGSFRSWDTALPLPGGSATADAVSSVAVAATARRRGVLSAMMSADLTGAAERGVPLAVLIAAEAPIYGRYGYGPAQDACTLALDTSGSATTDLLRPPLAGEGEVRVSFVDESALRVHAPGIYASAAAGHPGTMPRDDDWWDAALRQGADADRDAEDANLAVYAALARDVTGQGVGYARWSVKEVWDSGRSTSSIEVADLAGTTPAAHAALWRFLASLDLVATVRAHDRPTGDVLPWLLLDRRRASERETWDFLWVRVLDVPVALGSRVAGAAGSGVLEVLDEAGPTAGYASGRYAWAAEAGAPFVARRTDATPDVVVDVRALGSALLGHVDLHQLAASGDAHEASPGALTTLAGALRWSPTSFPTLTMF